MTVASQVADGLGGGAVRYIELTCHWDVGRLMPRCHAEQCPHCTLLAGEQFQELYPSRAVVSGYARLMAAAKLAEVHCGGLQTLPIVVSIVAVARALPAPQQAFRAAEEWLVVVAAAYTNSSPSDTSTW